MTDICYLSCEQPQTRRGQERRLALLVNACDLFLERGYDAVSLDDIVNHAGGSKASIYKYFGSKEGLFTAICDYRRELFFKDICVPFVSGKTDLKSHLIQTLMRFYQHIIQPKNIAFMRIFLEQSQNNTELAHYLYNKCAINIQNSISMALEQAHAANEIDCIHPLFSATMYFGILRDVEWRILMGLSVPADDTEIIDYIHYSVDLFLKAHQKNKGY
ncbi:MAG: TetR/AcrR family transcriptional regulator [Acinetobacter sp.]|nr:TetR/AcrR family transcriptional regulator [Acinetobacter sp.]MBP6352451.1 TetR/AcrR family transcriptional regulator [Acinetobacter sp.]MBP7217773.1 TetR/AcrR family transcriptional regulator [Acinetobacter sp.]TXJ03574.1 MAG: TetR/AcrR family transcriptional regulator [Acinetobacter sp.]